MFNWSGDQCSCGAWIVPAFKINKARVDVIYRQETRLLAEGVAGLKIASPVNQAAEALVGPRGPPEVINITKRVYAGRAAEPVPAGVLKSLTKAASTRKHSLVTDKATGLR